MHKKIQTTKEATGITGTIFHNLLAIVEQDGQPRRKPIICINNQRQRPPCKLPLKQKNRPSPAACRVPKCERRAREAREQNTVVYYSYGLLTWCSGLQVAAKLPQGRVGRRCMHGCYQACICMGMSPLQKCFMHPSIFRVAASQPLACCCNPRGSRTRPL
jgi:hypothetical protein